MVCRAVYTQSPSIEGMSLDHGRTDVLMPKELLDRPDIIAVLKPMGGKRMPERVATGRVGDPGFPNGFFDRPLQNGFMELMSFLLTGLPILIAL